MDKRIKKVIWREARNRHSNWHTSFSSEEHSLFGLLSNDIFRKTRQPKKRFLENAKFDKGKFVYDPYNDSNGILRSGPTSTLSVQKYKSHISAKGKMKKVSVKKLPLAKVRHVMPMSMASGPPKSQKTKNGKRKK